MTQHRYLLPSPDAGACSPDYSPAPAWLVLELIKLDGLFTQSRFACAGDVKEGTFCPRAALL